MNNRIFAIFMMLFLAVGTISFTQISTAQEDAKPTVSEEVKADAAEAEKADAKAVEGSTAEEAKPALPDPGVDPDIEKPVENKEFFAYLMKAVGGMKGAGAMGIAVILSQLLMLFMRSGLWDLLMGMFGSDKKWVQLAGKWKLSLLALFSIVVAWCGLMYSGLDWMTALVHSGTVTAFQVFFHQVGKQIGKKD